MKEGEVRPERAVEILDKEVVILKVKQHAEIEEKTQQHQRQTNGLLIKAKHHLAERIVDQNAAHDDRHIAGIVVAVKDKGCQHEKQLVKLKALGKLAQQEIDDQRHRQERQHEDVRIKEHG